MKQLYLIEHGADRDGHTKTAVIASSEKEALTHKYLLAKAARYEGLDFNPRIIQVSPLSEGW